MWEINIQRDHPKVKIQLRKKETRQVGYIVYDIVGGPKRFHDSFNFVFYIVGECISSAADTHLATDLTCQGMIYSLKGFRIGWI